MRRLVFCAAILLVSCLVAAPGIPPQLGHDDPAGQAAPAGGKGFRGSTCCGNGGGFTAENMSFDEACFRGTSLRRPIEWWYFDAVFDNGYSVEFHVNLGAAGRLGVVAAMMNFYAGGDLVAHAERTFPAWTLEGSSDGPSLWLSGQQVMEGFVNAGGRWVFNLSLGLDGCNVDLQFVSTSRAWKADILGMWWWGVVQPRASVTGSIGFGGRHIAVNGTGYHEHAWEGRLPNVKGWFWGKMAGEQLGVVWTDVIKYPWRHYRMVTVNTVGIGYVNLPAENIYISMENYTRVEGWRLPTSFVLRAHGDDVSVAVTARALDITPQVSAGPFNYWRYHVLVEGVVRRGDVAEELHTREIMDYTRFW